MSEVITGSLVANEIEGKTKIIRPIHQSRNEVLVISKNDLTAGNGKRHEVLIGKAKLANHITCKVFEILKCHGVALAYLDRFGPESFRAIQCRMIQLEVVVRFEAAGSYLERNPLVERGDVFDPAVVEFYLKTTDRQFAGGTLPCDDPLIRYDYRHHLWNIHSPVTDEMIGVIDSVHANVVDDLYEYSDRIEHSALRVAEIVRVAWARLGCRLQDIKLEFGVGPDGDLLLADVIDCDSWRMEKDGRQLSKQVFRDGAPMSEVEMVYQEVAHLSNFLRA